MLEDKLFMKKNDGREFESKVYDCILKIFKFNSYLGTENIFFHKKYFSKDRNDYIETDITVEIRIQNILFLIVVVECKDYKTSLDISEVEEFHSKLQQIGADNTKGVIVTSNGKVKRAALNYSKSKGISLARFYNDNIYYHLSDVRMEYFDISFVENNSKTIINDIIISVGEEEHLGNKTENVQMNNINKGIKFQEPNLEQKDVEAVKTSEEIEINTYVENLFVELSHSLERLYHLQSNIPYKELVQFCKSIIGQPCVYGVNGEVLTLELLEDLKRRFSNIYTEDYIKKAHKYLGKVCYDNNFFNSIIKHHIEPKYRYRYCGVPFKSLSEDNIGWLLVGFLGKFAVYIGDGYCVEARGIDYGIMKSSVYDSHWQRICKIEGVKYNLDDKNNFKQILNEIKLLGTR